MKKTMKRVLPVVALVLVVALASIGGTIAWLTDKTDEVTNTFTIGNINITLDEAKVNADGKPVDKEGAEVTDLDKAERVTENSYKLVPGNTYTKQPKVTVKANSEKCYLFVKVTEPALTGILTYELNTTGWTQGTSSGEGGNGVPTDVYYREVDASTTDTSFELLEGNKVSVTDAVTKTQIDALTASDYTMTFTAYAIQTANLGSAAEAWTKLGITD